MKYAAMLMVLVLIAVAADVRAEEYVWAEGLTPPNATYSQQLAWGYVRGVSAYEGGGPREIRFYNGSVFGPVRNEEPLRIGIAYGVRSDTLDLGDADTETWQFIRFLSQRFGRKVMVGHDPASKSVGFRTTIEGAIVKVESERNLFFFTNECNLIQVTSCDQMFNDRSVAYRSFYGSHEGVRARLDVIYFPLSREAILLAPAEYLPTKSAAGTAVMGQ